MISSLPATSIERFCVIQISKSNYDWNRNTHWQSPEKENCNLIKLLLHVCIIITISKNTLSVLCHYVHWTVLLLCLCIQAHYYKSCHSLVSSGLLTWSLSHFSRHVLWKDLMWIWNEFVRKMYEYALVWNFFDDEMTMTTAMSMSFS